MPIHTVNTLPKLLWLKEHEPDVWSRAEQFLLYEDFFIAAHDRAGGHQRLPGLAHAAARPGGGRWDDEILDAIGLDAERLGAVRPSGTWSARSAPELAAALGLARPPVVVTGGHDQACAALGGGVDPRRAWPWSPPARPRWWRWRWPRRS